MDVVLRLELGEVIDFAVAIGFLAPGGFLAVLARILLLEVNFFLGRIDGIEAFAACMIEGADHMPLTQAKRDGAGRCRSLVAIEPQAMEAVAQEQVGPAVAVVVDPGGGGQVVAGLLRQKMAIVAEAVPQVGKEPRTG